MGGGRTHAAIAAATLLKSKPGNEVGKLLGRALGYGAGVTLGRPPQHGQCNRGVESIGPHGTQADLVVLVHAARRSFATPLSVRL
jgi:hypothetical protein